MEPVLGHIRMHRLPRQQWKITDKIQAGGDFPEKMLSSHKKYGDCGLKWFEGPRVSTLLYEDFEVEPKPLNPEPYSLTPVDCMDP